MSVSEGRAEYLDLPHDAVELKRKERTALESNLQSTASMAAANENPPRFDQNLAINAVSESADWQSTEPDTTTLGKDWVRWGALDALVDEDLAPLILALWKAGIGTISSGLDDDCDIVLITFPGSVDAELFLELATAVLEEEEGHAKDGKSLDGDSFGGVALDSRLLGLGREKTWEYFANLDLESPKDEFGRKCYEPTEVRVSITVQFPQMDLPEVLERVRQGSQKGWYHYLFNRAKLP